MTTTTQQQEVLDFMLPDDERERRTTITAYRAHWFGLLESLADRSEALTPGRRRAVIAFAKRLLKERRGDKFLLSWRGVGKIRQSYLARDWQVSERTLRRWLTWARELGLLEWRVGADEAGIRFTLVEFTWRTFATRLDLSSIPAALRPGEPAEQPDMVSDQPDMVSDQPDMVSDQPDMVSDQPDTVSGHSVSPLDPLPSAAGCARESAAAVLENSETENRWTEARAALAALGVEQLPVAIRYASARKLTPAKVVAACRTAAANANRFDRGAAAAAVAYLRDGAWPASGIQNPESIAAAKSAAVAAAKVESEQRAVERDAVIQHRRALATGEVKSLSEILKSSRGGMGRGTH